MVCTAAAVDSRGGASGKRDRAGRKQGAVRHGAQLGAWLRADDFRRFAEPLLPLASDSAYGKLKATLIQGDPVVTPFRSQDMSVSVSRNDEKVLPIRFKLRLLTGYENGDYPCHIQVEGKDRDGNPLAVELPMLLHVRSRADGYAELHLEINDVVADLRARESSVLTAKVTNPYQNIEMRDALLTATEDKGEVTCEASEVIVVGMFVPSASTL